MNQKQNSNFLNLEELCWYPGLDAYLKVNDLSDFELAKVTAVHKERYIVRTSASEYEAEVTGNIRFTASGPADFPITGDWVAVMIFDEELAIIHHLLPRKNIIERRAVGKTGEKQPIAANLDFILIIQSVDRDFNLNRLERYITISNVSGIEPVLLLSKIDLLDHQNLQDKINQVKTRYKDLNVLPFSNISQQGYDAIEKSLKKGSTYCFMGSSGVGKSTLINHLLGYEELKTSIISTSTGKGRHTTSHRELFFLKNGSMVIDTPGMREVGITETADGSFETINTLIENCKFSDCTHTHEEDCAVLAALNEGEIDQSGYDNFMKMQRETARFQETIAEKRKKDKQLGKLYKQVLQHKKKNKFNDH